MEGEQSFQQKTDFWQFMIERLLASNAPAEEVGEEEDEEELGDEMKLDQFAEYCRFYDLRWTHLARQYPALGKKKSGSCPL